MGHAAAFILQKYTVLKTLKESALGTTELVLGRDQKVYVRKCLHNAAYPVVSTWLGAVGILMYEQGFGFIQLYMGPFWMALPAVSAILIGGASVNKASIPNVIIGTFLFQGIVTMTPTVMNSAFHMDMSEVIRVIVSNGMILYALTRKTEGGR